jgi:CRP/FNR family transcriptional regulator, anaerobic regulatory protein
VSAKALSGIENSPRSTAPPTGEGRCTGCPLPGVYEDEATLPAALLDSVLEHRRLEPGAILYRAGEKRGSIWVISDGALKTCELDLAGCEQVVGFHGPGEVLGLERIEIPAHHGFAMALEATRVCRVPVERLLDHLASEPELWRDILRIAGRQIVRAREVHRVLGRLQTGQRLAWFLLQGAGPRRSGGAAGTGQRIYLPMPRQDIASYLGMTLESVSRSFSALQREGLIQVDGRRVRLLDPAGLAERLLPQDRAAA